MGRVNKNTNNPKTTKNTPIITTEERLRIFANLIIDRIIEDQKKGSIIKKGI